MMRRMVVVVAVVAAAVVALLGLEAGQVEAKLAENLPPNAQLRIGVKHRPETCDRKSELGDTLRMHYTGTLVDGTKFDSSRDRDDPFEFVLGRGMVIKGWDQGLVGMCVGEKRKLTIPSDLGYGDRGSGATIPGKATLIFDVELLEIKNPPGGGDEDAGFPPMDMSADDEYGMGGMGGLGDLGGLGEEMGDFGAGAEEL